MPQISEIKKDFQVFSQFLCLLGHPVLFWKSKYYWFCYKYEQCTMYSTARAKPVKMVDWRRSNSLSCYRISNHISKTKTTFDFKLFLLSSYSYCLLDVARDENLWTEMKTFKLWISGLRLDPLFLLISRLKNVCSPLVINLQVN